MSGQPRPGFLQPVGKSWSWVMREDMLRKVHPLGNQTQCEIHYKGRFTSLGNAGNIIYKWWILQLCWHILWLLLCPFSFQLSGRKFSGQEQRWLSESDVRVGVHWRRESQNDVRMPVGWSPAQVHGKMVAWSKLGWLVVWNIFMTFHIFGMSSFQLTNSMIFQRGRYTTN